MRNRQDIKQIRKSTWRKIDADELLEQVEKELSQS